jgi:saccharopine dehydrogenase-like NADP-dependent oxidoreductase
LKVVVLGGYGNFGARICRALSQCSNIELIIAGRDGSQAAGLAKELGGRTSPLQLDISQRDFSQRLHQAGTELVIHTAGPFQQQGYAVPLAVAEANAHYIDLADGRRFVCDFPQAVDAAFRQVGRFAVAGASTVPSLSSAVVDYLAQGWQRIDSIESCIAPAQTAPRGVATLAAVLDYCGAPIQVWKDRAWATQYGGANPERIHFARLKPRIGALCDIPDLELFPSYYKGVQSVMFRAALEVGLTQRVFAGLATLRRNGWISRPERMAKFLQGSAKYIDFLGSSLGGMVVRVHGIDHAGQAVRRAWHIAADHDHGPEIPCMAAILLARRLANNEIKEIGAYHSTSWLRLADFEPEFAKWGMVTEIVEE